MMKKRSRCGVVFLLLLGMMLQCMVPCQGKAELTDFERPFTSGTFYNLKWNYNAKTDTLTISGKGKMEDYWVNTDGESYPWENLQYDVYGMPVKRIVVKEGVTSIGYNAFSGFEQVMKISLPKSLEKIGIGAFETTAIRKVNLYSNLKSIESDAFFKTNIESVRIPDSVTRLGDGAFAQCKRLKKVKLSNNLTQIEWAVFLRCPITSIKIPQKVTTIERAAFYKSGLKSITIPSNVEKLGARVFYENKNLTKVTFKTKKVTQISNKTFMKCKKLKKLTLPDSVTSIGKQAFAESGLENIVIPENVTTIGSKAFADCSRLKKVQIQSLVLEQVEKNAFQNLPKEAVIEVPGEKEKEYKALLRESGVTAKIQGTDN